MIYDDNPIDREYDYKENDYITCLKFLPKNEFIFREHFPEQSIYPASMIINSVMATLERFFEKNNEIINTENIILKKCIFKRKCSDGEILKIMINKIDSEYKFNVIGFFSEQTLCNGRFYIAEG